MKLKAISVIIAVLCVFSAMLTGCGEAEQQNQKEKKESKKITNSVAGIWSTKSPAFDSTDTEEDATYYYTFEKNGKASVLKGTSSVAGEWTYINSKGKATKELSEKVKIEIPTMLKGTYSVDVTGKDKKFTMTLKNDKGDTMTFKTSKLPKVENKVKDDFKTVDFITGKWQSVNDAETVYIFNSDGTCELHQPSLEVKGTYVVNEKDNAIEVTYLEQTQNKWNIPFLVKEEEKGKRITFVNSVFEKVEE